MTTKIKFFQKTLAIALATLFLSIPITNIAAAAPKHDSPPPRQEQRVDNKRNEKKNPPQHANRHENRNDKHHEKARPPQNRPDHKPEHRPAPPRNDYSHHTNSNDKAIGGFILGAVLGAVIANNT